MKTILNLTQHPATQEQKEAGVVDLPEGALDTLKLLLTFNNLKDAQSAKEHAAQIAQLIKNLTVIANDKYGGYDIPAFVPFREKTTHAMIGGAPFLMRHLEDALKAIGVQPLYAFTPRVVVEQTEKDGSVKKTAIFKHEGFVEA
jgi:hypothetical protein